MATFWELKSIALCIVPYGCPAAAAQVTATLSPYSREESELSSEGDTAIIYDNYGQ